MPVKYNDYMELRVLRYFLAVIQEENISRAAQFLGITQPTLSRQLHELEEELGTPLFVRGSRHISLTEQGALFSQRARQIVDLADKAQAEMIGQENGIAGTITIGLPDGGIGCSLAQTIVEFQKEQPLVRFKLLRLNHTDRVEQLELGLLDFMVTAAPADLDNTSIIPIMEQETILAVFPKENPLSRKLYVTAEDCKKYPLIYPEEGILRKRLHAFAPSCKPAITVTTIASGLSMTQAGGGLFFCPESAAPDILEYRPLEPPIHLEYSLAFKDRSRLSPAAGAFLRYLEQKNDF